MKSEDVRQLRAKLATRLQSTIQNPVIEEKELAAFDLLMSRRRFLAAAQVATIGALVTAGLPPTAWARRDKKLKVKPQDVGLTATEQASVDVATQVITGTELFQDTIYAQPVAAQQDINTHGIVEGARQLLRFQSDFESTDPLESQFLDTGWHYGPTELIQLEQVDGAWELVHYHHPWGPRTDGARTDALQRRVIMNEAKGLKNPTKIQVLTTTATNQFKKSSGQVTAGFGYMVFVEQDNGAGEHYIVVANGEATTEAPWSNSPIYPVRWEAKPISKIGITETSANYRSCDKITREAYGAADGSYDPKNANEQIVLYYSDKIYLLNLRSIEAFGFIDVTVANLPADAPNARVIHSDYPADSKTYINYVVLASTEKKSNGDHVYKLYSVGGNDDGSGRSDNRFNEYIDWTLGVFGGAYRTSTFTVPSTATSQDFPALDYTSVQNVQHMYRLAPDDTYHVKIANFGGDRIVAFTLVEDGSETPTFHLAGHFPLAFPDTNGTGKILTLSGGVSKFGGLRYVLCDGDGNQFLMRQRRAEAEDSPYVPPIYGNFTADGEPITSFSTTRDPLPSTTSPNSNLENLQKWVGISTGSSVNTIDAYNFLLSAALAFATDDTSQAQGIWLGSGIKAAYMPPRSNQDSSHVVVKQVQSGTSNIYGAFETIKNPVDKTWRLRQIATQQIVSGPGEAETGDHYQVTFTPANAYGKKVSLLSAVNENLQLEVRADSAVHVADDTNNLYYDIDRYTSFVALPNPGSGELSVVVKAESFSQVLYARLLDTSTLQPSSDVAMLETTGTTVFPWIQANLAAQAQARMANTGDAAALGGFLGITDTASYVSEATLKQSNTDSPWDTKQGFGGSDSNYQGIASYMNASGRNLATATQQNSFGALLGDSVVDPLTSVTVLVADPTNPTTTTTYDYANGTVASAVSAAGVNVPVGELDLGNFWKSISHALHDALHWLQHADDKVLSELSSGVQLVTSEVESVAVKVSADIMKQVNGVEQELNEVVNSVEEYASVVVNVVITIVKSSFLYRFVEILIALISLFIYFKKVLALSKSMEGFFNDLFTGGGTTSLPSVTIDSSSTAGDYLGPDNNTQQAFNNAATDNVASEIEKTLVDAISGNPLTKKLLSKVVSLLSEALNAATPKLPFSINLDDSVATEALNDVTSLTDDIVTAIAGLAESTATQLADDVANDLADPQTTFQNIGNQLGNLLEGIADEALGDLFSLIDQIAADGPKLAHDIVTQKDYVTIDITALADLCKLLGIGDLNGGKVSLSAGEAIFFPLAVIAWVTVYMHEGAVIDSVSQLQEDLVFDAGADLGSINTTRWNLVRIAIDTYIQEVLGLFWLIDAKASKGGGSGPTGAEKTLVATGAWFGLARWVNDFSYTTYNYVNATPNFQKDFDFGVSAFRTYTAAINTVLTLTSKSFNSGTGWKDNDPSGTDITQVMNLIVQAAAIGVDTVEDSLNSPSGDEVLNFVGQDIFRTQLIFLFVYNRWDFESAIEVFAVLILGAPATGAFCQELALNLSSPDPTLGAGTPEEEVPACPPRRGWKKRLKRWDLKKHHARVQKRKRRAEKKAKRRKSAKSTKSDKSGKSSKSDKSLKSGKSSKSDKSSKSGKSSKSDKSRTGKKGKRDKRRR